MISIGTIKAARDGDFAAMAAINEDMVDRVSTVANRAAGRRGHDFYNLADEYRQVANVAMWECVNSYEGDDVDGFYAYTFKVMESRVRDAAWGNEGGVPAHQVKAFAKAVERADGDVELAVELAQIHPYSSRGCMSRDVAYAAKLAWMGVSSLDANLSVGSSAVRGDLIGEPASWEEVDETAPARVSANKIKAAFSSLEEYVVVRHSPDELMDACRMLSVGVVTESILDILSESVRLPKERKARLFVQGAFGILAAAVHSADHSATPADEYDDRTEEFPEARAHVAHMKTFNLVFDALSEANRAVLCHTYGLRGHTRYGTDKLESADDVGMSEETGYTKSQITNHRSRGKQSFAKRWIKIMARSKAHAAELEEEARKNQRAGGYGARAKK